MLGPGNRTSDPVPNDMTGYFASAVERRKCASMDRLLLLAHTVQKRNLYPPLSPSFLTPSTCGTASSTAAGVAEAISVLAASGGGGGGGGGAADTALRLRGSSDIFDMARTSMLNVVAPGHHAHEITET